MKEWNEKRLDEELEALMTDIPEQKDLEKKIIQSINRRIRRCVWRVLLGIAVVIAAAFLIINPLMNHLFFNPYKMNREPEQKVLGVMRDYFEITGPYREIVSLDVTQKGFARYELEMQIVDLTEPVNIGTTNVWCQMNCGRYDNIIDPDLSLGIQMGRFEAGYEEQEEIIEKIKDLPASAVIYISVSDTEIKSLDELRNTAAEAVWIQVYQPDVEFQGGISLNPVVLYREDDQREDLTEEELLGVYLDNLENLTENREVWEQFGLSDGHGTIYDSEEALEKTYENAGNLTELGSRNYCVYGQRDEILQFLEENTLSSIYVENVRLW